MSPDMTINDEDTKVIEPYTLVQYTKEDLKLFSETVCREIGLNNLKKFLALYEYNPDVTLDAIHKISQGITAYEFREITESAKKFHEELFDMMYIKKLIELPLLINHGDSTLIPVVNWRFKVAK
jgi:hypothetical protein